MATTLNKSELVIVVILRIFGCGGLLAIPAIFFPYDWMNACHRMLGLGTLPDVPIVSYLARSLSAFYAIAGAFLIYVSLDVRKNRRFVRLWAIIAIVLGFVLFGIDVASGLPSFWTLFEGPMILLMGSILLIAQRHIEEHVAIRSADE